MTIIICKKKRNNEENNSETDETIGKVVDEKTYFIPMKVEKVSYITIYNSIY